MAEPGDRKTALWVVKRLRKAGFRALFAGGCVRDMLLKRRSTDYDVATNATPKQVNRLFRRVLLVGAKFGVAMVIHRNRMVEVTTFRSDESYSDHRRPDAVRFTSEAEDARRRDFTINGMFYDPIAKKVIDSVGGQEDLQNRTVRTIGDPDARFAEDYLRMIRAVRFAVHLGFRIAPKTATAIRHHAPNITSISGERIFDELSKMLTLASAPDAMRKLEKLSLARAILPELFEKSETWNITLRRVKAVAKKRTVGLTLGAMLVDLPSATIRAIIRRWGASNDLRDELCFYCQHLGDWRAAAEMPLCEFKRLMANPHFESLRSLWFFEERMDTRKKTQSRRIARRAAAIPKSRIAPPPFVTGSDLIRIGLTEGPRLGRILKRLYDAQLNEQVTSRRQALAMGRRLISQTS